MVITDETRAPHATSGLAERVGRRYLICMLLVLVLGYLLPIPIARMPIFNRINSSYYGHILDYGFDLENQNADIVVFGDSTALYGVDTVQLSKDLGVKVINIPSIMATLSVVGERNLQRYMAHNRPPRLIVFYFAPWDLNYKADNKLFFEGEEQFVRHESVDQIAKLVRERPADMLAFPFRFYVMDRNKFHQMPVLEGHSPYPKVIPLPANCEIPEKYASRKNDETALELEREFTSPVTQTMIYMAPLPNCRNAERVREEHFPGVDADPPAILPAQNFANDTFYTHPLAASSSKTTELLATELRRKLAQLPQNRSLAQNSHERTVGE
jgi:hypothetical protein